jgi:hypothetical protein
MGDRLKKTLTFKSMDTILENRPDLFNPLWINSTFCFALSVGSNISHYLMTEYEEKGNYNFDYKRVVAAYGLVFSASIILPLLLFFLVVCMGMKMTLQNVCKCF